MKLRVAKPSELDLILDWAAHEGWNPGVADAPAFHASDPYGVFVAEIASDPVAAISVVNHCDNMAFLGLYLCLPDYRGQGIGYALWTHALAHAGERVVGLDGVAEQQANYAKSGFVPAGASLRFQGGLTAAPDPAVRLATARDLPELVALDRAANGYARPRFLSAWLAGQDSRKTVVLERAGACRGFATVRRCRTGVKIGPIVADDATVAITLARAALAVLAGDTVIIDVPSDNEPLVQALADLGFAETFATARMYRGAPPVSGPNRQAIATMELG